METTSAQESAYQTWEEICRAYPDEWVILVDMQEDPEDEHTLGGVVMAHSPNRKQAGAAIPRDRPIDCGIFFTGQIRRRGIW